MVRLDPLRCMHRTGISVLPSYKLAGFLRADLNLALPPSMEGISRLKTPAKVHVFPECVKLKLIPLVAAERHIVV